MALCVCVFVSGVVGVAVLRDGAHQRVLCVCVVRCVLCVGVCTVLCVCVLVWGVVGVAVLRVVVRVFVIV